MHCRESGNTQEDVFMKREYFEPIAKIFLCEKEDVITTSVTVKDDDNVVVWPGMEGGILWE